jgi:Skp family chaperone for outer membrane proteins
MKNRQVWMSLTLVLVIFFVAFAGARAGGAAKGRPVAVAVVDIEKVFNSIAEKTQVKADLTTMAEKLGAEKAAKKKELEAATDDLKAVAVDNPNYKKMSEDLQQKAFEFDSWQRWQQARISNEDRLRTVALYKKICESAGAVAKENGYDIVLFKEPDVNRLLNLKPEALDDAMSTRKLLWYADDLEITDVVVNSMNNAFKNVAKPAAPAPK